MRILGLFLLDHGLLVAQELAHVLSGGASTSDQTVSEDDLWKLELEAFSMIVISWAFILALWPF